MKNNVFKQWESSPRRLLELFRPKVDEAFKKKLTLKSNPEADNEAGKMPFTINMY